MTFTLTVTFTLDVFLLSCSAALTSLLALFLDRPLLFFASNQDCRTAQPSPARLLNLGPPPTTAAAAANRPDHPPNPHHIDRPSRSTTAVQLIVLHVHRPGALSELEPPRSARRYRRSEVSLPVPIRYRRLDPGDACPISTVPSSPAGPSLPNIVTASTTTTTAPPFEAQHCLLKDGGRNYQVRTLRPTLPSAMHCP